MTHQTARFILKRHGLACFSLQELRGLLSDRYGTMPTDVTNAIKCLFEPRKPQNWGNYGY